MGMLGRQIKGLFLTRANWLYCRAKSNVIQFQDYKLTDVEYFLTHTITQKVWNPSTYNNFYQHKTVISLTVSLRKLNRELHRTIMIFLRLDSIIWGNGFEKCEMIFIIYVCCLRRRNKNSPGLMIYFIANASVDDLPCFPI